MARLYEDSGESPYRYFRKPVRALERVVSRNRLPTIGHLGDSSLLESTGYTSQGMDPSALGWMDPSAPWYTSASFLHLNNLTRNI